MSARGSKVLLEIAGAWWVGWCLSQLKLSLFQSVQNLVQMCQNYMLNPRTLSVAFPEGVLILIIFGSINLEFKN
jgi:hypothetical protein